MSGYAEKFLKNSTENFLKDFSEEFGAFSVVIISIILQAKLRVNPGYLEEFSYSILVKSSQKPMGILWQDF